MANISQVGQRIRYTPAAVGRSVKAVRQYPVLPMFIMLVVLILPSIFANLVAPHDPIQADLSHRLEPPAWISSKSTVKTVSESRNNNELISVGRAQGLKVGPAAGQTSNPNPELLSVGDEVEIVDRPSGNWARPLGTDKLGRDLLTRMIYGARYSLYVSLAVICISGVVGTSLGIIAAYFGGWVDYLISRLIDIFMALPGILILLVLVVVIGPGLTALIAVISGLLWSRYARLVRGEVLSIKNQDYIAKARVTGSSHVRIMIKHIFPNVFNSLVILATLQVGYVIIIESSASFLGAGIPRPTPSWGAIVADGRDLIVQAAWWISLFSGLAIVMTVLSVNLVGDWLRDKLDPKLRQI
jgi:peptide/nickel transport system permease protein